MKKAFKISLCILLCAVLSSCSMGAKKINDLTIVQALSVDEKANSTKIAMQYLNLAGGSGSTEALESNITQIKSAQGKNIPLAIFSASKSASNDIFFGQNKLVVFGFDFAKNSLSSGMDFLLNSPYSRPDVLVAIGKPSGEDIINSKEKDSKIPAESIYKLLKLGEKNGAAASPTACDLINLYSDETSDIFLPVLEAKDGKTACSSIAFFSGHSYAGELFQDEVLAFLLIKNKVLSSQLSVKTRSLGRVTLDIISSNSKSDVKIKNGAVNFNIGINMKLKISQTDKGINQKISEKQFEEVQKACEKRIKALCSQTVYKCFQNKSDPFMCARYLYSENPDLYNLLKDNWKNELGGIKVNTRAEIRIQRVD